MEKITEERITMTHEKIETAEQIRDRETLSERAGYAEGLSKAPEGITADSVRVRLTPTKVEQLKLIQKYDKPLFEAERPIEDIARDLLYDAIRAKYNLYIERYGEEK